MAEPYKLFTSIIKLDFCGDLYLDILNIFSKVLLI